MRNFLFISAALIAASVLSGCGGGSSSAGVVTPGLGLGPHLAADVQVNNYTSATTASFDLTWVDPATKTAYFTDRNNASVDRLPYGNAGNFNVTAYINAGAGTFTGCRDAAFANVSPGCAGAVTANSGPNGLDGIGPGGSASLLMAADVGQLMVVNTGTNTIAQVIPSVFSPVAGTTKNRNDEGCFLPATAPGNALGFGVYAVASPSQAGGGSRSGVLHVREHHHDDRHRPGDAAELEGSGGVPVRFCDGDHVLQRRR